MISAFRDSRAVGDSNLYYLLETCSQVETLIEISENSTMVDGIGGIVWEGSIVLSEVLKACDARQVCLVELGCGAGLCGIVGAAMGMDSVLTDREVDLATYNAQRCVSSKELTNGGAIAVMQFDWAVGAPPVLIEHLIRSTRPYRVIAGVEVACLLKQQPFLVNALCELSNSRSIILITFDKGSSRYEASFRERMQERGFLAKQVYSGSVVFEEYSALVAEKKILRDFPPPVPGTKRTYGTLTSSADATGSIELECCARHGVTMFYRLSAMNTCRSCSTQFSPAFNSNKACRTHAGFYVCRLHPAETRLSIDGRGDGLGYYGNGIEGVYASASINVLCKNTVWFRCNFFHIFRLGC